MQVQSICAAKHYPMRKRVPGSKRWLREQSRAASATLI